MLSITETQISFSKQMTLITPKNIEPKRLGKLLEHMDRNFVCFEKSKQTKI